MDNSDNVKGNYDWKSIYWFVILLLLLLPLTNSFIKSVETIVKSVILNNEYKNILGNLLEDNIALNKKIKYYKTTKGMKSLVKERLNKVEEGEIIIKFTDKDKMLE